MPSEKIDGYLAHISDTVTALEEQIKESREVQQNILAVLNLLLEANEAQTEMLGEILAAAAQEAEPSPIADRLEALCAQVQRMDESQVTLIEAVGELPKAIGEALAASLAGSAVSDSPP